MSFFRSFYSKMATSESVRKDSFVADATDMDEYMEDDGFVVYTEKTTSTTMSGASSKVEFNYLQNSSTARSFPSTTGPLHDNNYSYGSYMKMDTTNVIKAQNEPSTFLTASDIPMKLARHLDILSKINTFSSTSYGCKPDIQKYYYDFNLEKKTLESQDYGCR